MEKAHIRQCMLLRAAQVVSDSAHPPADGDTYTRLEQVKKQDGENTKSLAASIGQNPLTAHWMNGRIY